ncbi:MAG: GerMN domain-containing protein [Spirochaetia bacterium]|nr:GerMN domain-containing protein [Spirochaetia bacterium]
MFLRNPGTPPMDTLHTNRVLLTMAGVSVLLVFMDLQAGRQLRDRVESVPDKILSAQPISREDLQGARRQISQAADQLPGDLPAKATALPGQIPAGIQKPIKQSALSIFQGVTTQGSKALGRDEKLSVAGGWDLFFIEYRGKESALVRVRRKWPGETVTVRAVLQYLQKGPNTVEIGLLNAFENVRVGSSSLKDGVLTVECDSGLLRMSSHVIQDRVDQIVYTMTQFREIKGVRLVVEGERRPYLDRTLKRSGRKFKDYN